MTVNVYWTRAIALGSGERHFISPLRFQEPVFLTKHIPYKEFLGPSLLHCPGMVDELKRTVVIKSPVGVSLEYEGTNLKVRGQDPEFGSIFFGQPQGQNGIHQLGFGYIFFADKPLMATNLPAYYDNNSYTENTNALCGSYDIGRWLRPGVRPLFQMKPGKKRNAQKRSFSETPKSVAALAAADCCCGDRNCPTCTRNFVVIRMPLIKKPAATAAFPDSVESRFYGQVVC